MAADNPKTSSSFWTSIPGILTGFAALITAIVGAVTLIFPHRDTTSDAASTRSDVVRANAATVTQDTKAGAEHQTYVLRPGDWLDFESGVTGTAAVNGALDWAGTQLNLYGQRNVVIDQPTDKAGCERELKRRADAYLSREQLAHGAILCVSTKQGVIAELEVHPPGPDNRLSIDSSVWR
jgi:hypothetical protein